MLYKTNQHRFSIHTNTTLIEKLALKAVKRSLDSKKAGKELIDTLVSPTFSIFELNKAENECLENPSICI